MKNSSYLKILFGAVPICLLLFVVIKLAVAPVSMLNRLEQGDDTPVTDLSYVNSIEDSLVRVFAYKQALLELSSDDSIHLILDLSGKEVLLSIKGVTIHQVNLTSVKVDPLLRSISNDTYIKNFGRPLAVSSMQATIVKEPIVERQAPKDSLEASLNAYEPDTLIQFPAFLQISFENGVLVRMEQEVNPTLRDKKAKWKLRLDHWKNRSKAFVSSSFGHKSYQYLPEIEVKLPADELRAIYRALPNQSTKVVLRY